MSRLVNDRIIVTLDEAKTHIIDCIKARLVPFLEGPPAAGKSAVIRQIAEEYNLKLIDLRLSQCDPCDLLGFPRINEATGRAGYAPMDTFPLEGDEVPDGYVGWLIIFDEITSAVRSVQAAAYKTLHEKEVGNRKIHPKVAMVAAGNRAEDNAVVEEMSTALQSRMVHLEVEVDHDVWLEWAMRNGIDHRITSYIKFKPDMLFTFSPDHTDKTYAAPRTWEYCSRLILDKPKLTHEHLALLGGTIGQGVAREFIQHTKIYDRIPSIEDIKRKPDSTHVPDEPGVLFALTGSIASHADKGNIGQLLKYTKRLPREFEVTCLREVVRRHPDIDTTPAMIDWINANAEALF